MQTPNIVLIVADDMGYGDFGVFNDGLVNTPALDQLATESLCLTQHYAGSPVCSPSRAALLTGRYPHRTGAITPQEILGLDRIALREITLGDIFKRGGYKTGLIGKWHNGALDPRFHPNRRGFDEFIGFRGGWADYYQWRLDYNGTFRHSDGRYLTDVLTAEAINFVQRHQQSPFFLSLMYNAPHSPLQAPTEIVQPYLEAGLIESVAMTYAMIEVMDHGIGQLMAELDRLNLADNTIVMFTSDNGPAFTLREDQVPPGMSRDTRRYNCGLNGAKGSVYEGGIRVPMVMRWPDGGLSGGQHIAHLCHFTDWMPTLTGIASLQRHSDLSLDGYDILPLLRGEMPGEQPRRFWQWNGYSPLGSTNAAVRDGDWKLVRPQIKQIRYATPEDERIAAKYVEWDIAYKYHPEQITALMPDPEPARIIPNPLPPELYNLQTDPLEQHNLAAQEPTRVSQMLVELETWFEKVETERQRIPAS